MFRTAAVDVYYRAGNRNKLSQKCEHAQRNVLQRLLLSRVGLACEADNCHCSRELALWRSGSSWCQVERGAKYLTDFITCDR